MSYLEGLNPNQKKAVMHQNGPLLVLAGAGAGKTRVITYRILHLIAQGVAPEKILAVTFTNKAASEMRDRIHSLLKKDISVNRPVREFGTPYVSTFHALGVDILRENFRTLGVTKYFTIFDRNDSLRTMKESISRAGYDPKQFEPKKILGTVSKQKGEGVSLLEFEVNASNDYYNNIVSECWRHYENILRSEKAFDFDDLLLKTVQLLKENPNIRKRYQNIWSHIHIDEYQDTNTVQNELAKLLVGEGKNICVVGDIDQCIYTWRGAKVGNMLTFEKDFDGAQTILLEENYRSSKTIIAASNDIIAKNKNRQEKNLFTNNPDGEPISIFSAYSEIDEAYYITNKVASLIKEDTPINEIAVLYRANFQSRMLEEAFLDENIPYHVLGTRFFDRKEVKDVLSYVRLARNPESITDLKRIINEPKRGIGKVTLLRIVEGKEDECSPALQTKIEDFRSLMKEISNVLHKEKASDALKWLIKKTGIEDDLNSKGDEGLERLENIRELVTLASKYDRLGEEGVEKLLTDAALATDQDALEQKSDGVKLMTVHAAKGLEFDVVFVTGLEEGLFPHEGFEKKIDDEEERRLFYVALTRARKKVFLTSTQVRTIYGSQHINVPSEFLTDIDEQFVEEEQPFETTSDNSEEKIVYLDLDEL
jgi:DNA helicase-2/ATP-dependent DNA helicase PcrA